MTKKILTLCIVHQSTRVLLGMKKRGFGQGRWNGFGGKTLPDEAIEDAARREALEEAGITLGDIEKVGILDFEFQGDPQILEVHIFKVLEFSGTPTETEEMKPQWFPVSGIPYNTMWPDDIFWMPLFLEGKKFTGRFLFGKGDTIQEQLLEEVPKV
jgi:8-oxo-dGTP diphosphatase/2-hydroxy-dATP diphosphatase